jgi:hypothetical protein
MAAPFPPAGGQKQYTERPLKVYGEQYLAGQALPVHVVIDPVLTLPDGSTAPIYADGQARAPLAAGWVVLHPGDWLISSRFSGAPVEVISNEEFAERFGGGPAVVEGT